MTKRKNMSRRSALKLGAAATALPLVHIRTAGAAGKLAIGFWDHWVPGGNDMMQKQVNAWADKNKVEVTADFITGNGNKLLMTGAPRRRPRPATTSRRSTTGTCTTAIESLEPVDDVMKYLTGKYGAVERHCRVPGEAEGPLDGGADQLRHADQAAVRADRVVQEERPRRAGDVSGEAGAHRGAGRVDLGNVPEIRGAGKKDGMTFALGMGGNTNTDAIDTHGALFQAYGAEHGRRQGQHHARTPEMRQCWSHARSW